MSLSAYPCHYSEALASETILSLWGIRLTPAQGIDLLLRATHRDYFVPDIRLTLYLGRHYLPGLLEVITGLNSPASSVYPLPFGTSLSALFGWFEVTIAKRVFVFLSVYSYARRDSTLG